MTTPTKRPRSRATKAADKLAEAPAPEQQTTTAPPPAGPPPGGYGAPPPAERQAAADKAHHPLVGELHEAEEAAILKAGEAAPPESTEDEAKARAEEIRAGFNSMMDFHDQVLNLITEAHERRDFIALKYDTFSEYVDGEFGIDKLPRLDRNMRMQWIITMRMRLKLSQRETAAIAGVSQQTVSLDEQRAVREVADLYGLTASNEVADKLTVDTRPDDERVDTEAGIPGNAGKIDTTGILPDNAICDVVIKGTGAGRPPKCYLPAGHIGDHTPKPGKAAKRVAESTFPAFPKVRSTVESIRKSAGKPLADLVEKLAERHWSEANRIEMADLLADSATELHESADLMIAVAGELRSHPKGK